ncbi:uncharacterized protein LOC144152619 isoform X1 [Haemaphysalis longicornis]
MVSAEDTSRTARATEEAGGRTSAKAGLAAKPKTQWPAMASREGRRGRPKSSIWRPATAAAPQLVADWRSPDRPARPGLCVLLIRPVIADFWTRDADGELGSRRPASKVRLGRADALERTFPVRAAPGHAFWSLRRRLLESPSSTVCGASALTPPLSHL